MILVQVKTAAYQGNLQNCLVYAPSSEPFVPSVGFYFSVGSLRLYGTIHPEQRPMNAVQVVQNLFVERCQFIVQPDDSVKLTLVTFGSVRTAAAIFTLVKFHGSPILVSFHWLCSEEEKFLVIWTNQPSLFIYPKIHSTVWIVAVLLALAFLFVHGELHVFLHTMFFTIQVIIQIPVTCICYRILWVFMVSSLEFFH